MWYGPNTVGVQQGLDLGLLEPDPGDRVEFGAARRKAHIMREAEMKVAHSR